MDEQSELKMWLAVRKDLPMPKGKLAVQSGHGYVTAILEAQAGNPELVAAYMEANQPKIAVHVKNESELRKAYDACRKAGLPCAIIEDEGRTVFGAPTTTVMAVGPCHRGQLPSFVGRLRLIPLVEDAVDERATEGTL